MHFLLASSGYTLPTGIHPTTSTGTGIIALGISILNIILGIGGFIIIAYGMVRFLQVIWQHFKGETADKTYNHGFIVKPGKMPGVLAAGLDIVIGMVVVGLCLSGAWISIVNGLITLGGHTGNVISQHLK